MNEKNLSSLLKDFLFPVAVITLILLFAPLFLLPKIQQVLDLKEEIKKQENEITKLSQKLADLQTLSEAELFNSSSLLLETLPVEKDYFKMLSIIKKVFSDNNVYLKTFSFSPGIVSTPSASPETSALGSMQIDTTYNTPTFNDFKNFATEVEKFLPLINIDSVSLGFKTASQSAGLPGFEGAMLLKGFFSSLPKTLGRPESPLPKISNSDQKLIEELRAFGRYQPEIVSGESVLVGRENPFSP